MKQTFTNFLTQRTYVFAILFFFASLASISNCIAQTTIFTDDFNRGSGASSALTNGGTPSVTYTQTTTTTGTGTLGQTRLNQQSGLDYAFQAVPAATANAATTTSSSIASGNSTVNVTSTTGIVVGSGIAITGGAIPSSATVTQISGSTITFAPAATASAASGTNITFSNPSGGDTYASAPYPTGTLYNTTLSSNSSDLVWTFHFKTNRSGGSLSSFTASNYGGAVVLAATSGNFTVGSSTNGYAVTLERGTTNLTINLKNFTNGIGYLNGTTTVGTASNVIKGDTTAASGNLYGLVPTPTGWGSGASTQTIWIAVKVIYTPSSNTWKLYYRDENVYNSNLVGSISDFTTNMSQCGVRTNSTYTGSTLTNFGFLWNHAATTSSTSNTLLVDNFKMTINNPTINAPSVSALIGFTATASTTSAEQSFTISGQLLTNSIVLTAPVSGDYEVSTTSGSGFGSTATLTNTATQSATIFVRLKSGLSDGSKTGNITIASTGATTTSSYTVALTGSVASTPTLTPSVSSLTQFANTAAGANSASSNFTLSGVNLSSGNVTVTAPTNFAVSIDNSTFGSSVTITPSSGSVASTIYVRYSPTGNGGYTGNVVIAWSGLADQNVAVSGYLTTFYYKKVSGSGLASTANWSGTADGNGTSVPSNFTTASITYKILANATTDAALTVSGTSSKIIVGDPTVAAVTLTIASGFGITGTIDVAAASSGSNSLILSEITSTGVSSTPGTLILGTLDASSEVHFNAGTGTTSATQMIIPAVTYGKLIIDDNYAAITNGATTIATSLSVPSNALLAANNSGNYIVINTGATVTINGTFNVQRLPGALSFSVVTPGTSFGSLQFKDAYNSGTPNFTLGSSSTVIYARTSSASTSTQAISVLPSGVSYANLSISDGTGSGQLVTKTFAAGIYTVSGTFTINHTVPATSSISLGTASVTVNGALVITKDTLTTGTGTLTLGAAATATIAPAGILQISSGSTVDFASRPVTLQSSSAGTAAIATIAGTLTPAGATNVTVERYIPSSGRRAYVLVGAPLNSAASQTIYNGWQEAGVATAGFGTIITGGAAGGTLGFDLPITSAKSIFTYNDVASPGSKWTSLSNTNATNLSAGAGYLLYVRGDRTLAATTTNNTNNSTVLRATGTIQQGSISPSLLTGANKYTLIANPYPCAINWNDNTNITKTNLTGSFTVYDSNLGIFVSSDGTNKTPSSGVATGNQQPGYIQSGQAFFVQNNGTGNGAITFTEAAKTTAATTTSSTTVFGEDASKTQLNINVFRVADNSFADGVVALFGKNYKAAVDANEDINKFTNFNETFGLRRSDVVLGLEARPTLSNTSKDTLYFNLSNFAKKSYKLVIDGSNLSTTTATLEDRFTGTSTAIDLAGTTTYNFNITADSASSSKDRFIITLGSTAVSVVIADGTAATGLYVKMSPNPVRNQLQVSFKTATAAKTIINVINSLGQVVSTVNAGDAATGTVSVPVAALASGVYTVQLVSGGKVVNTQQVVKAEN